MSGFCERKVGFLHLISHHLFILKIKKSEKRDFKIEEKDKENYINKILHDFSEFDF